MQLILQKIPVFIKDMKLYDNGLYLNNIWMKKGPTKSKQFNAKAFERPGLTEEEVLEIK